MFVCLTVCFSNLFDRRSTLTLTIVVTPHLMIKLIISYSNVKYYIVIFHTLFYSIWSTFLKTRFLTKKVQILLKMALKFK